jgi:transposase InsO family protein
LIEQSQKYKAVKEVSEELGYSIKFLCEIIELNRSSYYKWMNKSKTDRDIDNEELLDSIKELHASVRGIYGYRRIAMNLGRILDRNINHKRVRRIMRENDIECIIRRKRKRYRKTTQLHVSENILNREFKADKPNEKWLTDVTELKYGNCQKAYLSAIIDLYDNSVVAYNLSKRNNNPLVIKNLDLAIAKNRGSSPLLHSDRGFQYTSNRYNKKMKNYGMIHSMSRVGRCLDNAPMEGFFGILKVEKYYLNKYDTYEMLEKDIDDYMYFYNNDRLQKRLGKRSPLEYRRSVA